MKKRLLFICCIMFLLIGCSKDPVEEAKAYIESGEYESAKEILLNIDNKDKSQQSYDLLVDIFDKEDNIEKLEDVIEEYSKEGYEIKNDHVIVKIFSYYDDLGDSDTVKELLAKEYLNVKLPDDIYIRNIVEANRQENMEIIKVMAEDINYDGKNEIIVTLGRKDQGQIDPNLFTALQLMVFKADGTIIYNEKDESHSVGESVIEVFDFTGDGKNELYYKQSHFTNFIFENIRILDFKGDTVKDLYDDEDLQDFHCVRLGENTAKVFSQAANKSFLLKRNESMDFYDTSDMRVNFLGSKLKNDKESMKGLIQESYSVWDDGGNYGEVEFIYEYEDQSFIYKDFNFKANDGVEIIEVREGESYDNKERARNEIIGFWEYDENQDYTEQYMIKISDDSIVQYIKNSDLLSDEKYEIIDYDLDNEIIEIKTEFEQANSKYNLTDYNKLEITYGNGHKSQWTYLYNTYRQ